MSRKFNSPMPLVRTGVMTSAMLVVSVLGRLRAQVRLAQQAFVGTLLVLRLADDEIEHDHPARVADAAGIVRLLHAHRAGGLAPGVGVDSPCAPRLRGLRERRD